MNVIRNVLVAAIAIALLIPAARSAQAGVKCDVIEFNAKETGNGVDKKLQRLASHLKKMPLKVFSSFAHMKTQTVPLSLQKPQTVTIRAGRLSLVFGGLIKAAGKKDRVRLSFSVDNLKGQRTYDTRIEMDENSHQIFVGLGRVKLADGKYVLALSCHK